MKDHFFIALSLLVIIATACSQPIMPEGDQATDESSTNQPNTPAEGLIDEMSSNEPTNLQDDQMNESWTYQPIDFQYKTMESSKNQTVSLQKEQTTKLATYQPINLKNRTIKWSENQPTSLQEEQTIKSSKNYFFDPEDELNSSENEPENAEAFESSTKELNAEDKVNKSSVNYYEDDDDDYTTDPFNPLPIVAEDDPEESPDYSPIISDDDETAESSKNPFGIVEEEQPVKKEPSIIFEEDLSDALEEKPPVIVEEKQPIEKGPSHTYHHGVVSRKFDQVAHDRVQMMSELEEIKAREDWVNSVLKKKNDTVLDRILRKFKSKHRTSPGLKTPMQVSGHLQPQFI